MCGQHHCGGVFSLCLIVGIAYGDLEDMEEEEEGKNKTKEQPIQNEHNAHGNDRLDLMAISPKVISTEKWL